MHTMHPPCVFSITAVRILSTTAAELCRSLKYHSPTLCYTSRPGLRTYLPESVVPLPLSKDTTCQWNTSNQQNKIKTISKIKKQRYDLSGYPTTTDEYCSASFFSPTVSIRKGKLTGSGHPQRTGDTLHSAHVSLLNTWPCWNMMFCFALKDPVL